MIDEPRTILTEARLTAYIPIRVPRAEIGSVMGPGLKELRAEVESQGIAVTGPWFTHHTRMSAGFFEFEISVPVAAVVMPAGRVRPGVWPAMKMAFTIYSGPYEGLGAAWKEFDAWIWGAGLSPGSDLWECYAGTGQTELSRQIVD